MFVRASATWLRILECSSDLRSSAISRKNYIYQVVPMLMMSIGKMGLMTVSKPVPESISRLLARRKGFEPLTPRFEVLYCPML